MYAGLSAYNVPCLHESCASSHCESVDEALSKPDLIHAKTTGGGPTVLVVGGPVDMVDWKYSRKLL